jgi:hypothetical protein
MRIFFVGSGNSCRKHCRNLRSETAQLPTYPLETRPVAGPPLGATAPTTRPSVRVERRSLATAARRSPGGRGQRPSNPSSGVPLLVGRVVLTSIEPCHAHLKWSAEFVFRTVRNREVSPGAFRTDLRRFGKQITLHYTHANFSLRNSCSPSHRYATSGPAFAAL